MIVADLHIHSRYSRATAKSLNPENLWLHAQLKGVDLLGSGDFTHAQWLAELKEKLVPSGDGAYLLKPELGSPLADQVPGSCARQVRFLLSGEISCIYKRHGKTRKVHCLILMPDFDAVERLNARLDKIGNIHSDGRPILGLDAHDLLELCLEVEPETIFIPAHIWTPWFSLFGSKSGFDSIEECFDDLTGHIHALETGLSSDPPMNWRLSALDRYTLVSHSDAHSPAKLAREADLLNCPPTYQDLAAALADPAGDGFAGTLEFFPHEGKYHLDGHRKCKVRQEPGQTRAGGGLCPVCGKPVTVGVLSRVEDLADRPPGQKPPHAKPFESLAPLSEVVGEVMQRGPGTKGVQTELARLLGELGPELFILRQAPMDELERVGGPVLAEGIRRMRTGQVILQGGYDGEFGVVGLFSASERQAIKGQGRFWDLKRPEEPKPRAAPAKPRTKLKKKAAKPADAIRLNPEQDRAVSHRGAHLIVRAGPGTGKTRVLVSRAAGLVKQGVLPSSILALSFTNKAAGEMAQRLAAALPGRGQVRAATFHALGLAILSEALGGAPDVAGEDQRLELIAPIAKQAGVKKRDMALSITRFKQTDQERPHGELAPMYQAYQDALAGAGLRDLDDLVREPVLLMKEHDFLAQVWQERFKHILVDEYQDLNQLQATLLKTLCGPDCLVFAIGDPDQAIYGFRGAQRGIFQRFASDFPGAVTLGLKANYRSRAPILDAALGLISADPDPARSAPRAMLGGGEPPMLCALNGVNAEARWIAGRVVELLGGLDSRQVDSSDGRRGYAASEVAVLYRLHAQAGPIAQALEEAGVPVQVAGKEPLAETDPLDFKAQRVSLLTMHAAKGLEWPVVFAAGLEQGLLPYEPPSRDPASLDEERRLLFVAMTRAQDRLFLTRAKRRSLYGKSYEPGPSPLLDDIAPELVEPCLTARPKPRARQLGLFS